MTIFFWQVPYVHRTFSSFFFLTVPRARLCPGCPGQPVWRANQTGFGVASSPGPLQEVQCSRSLPQVSCHTSPASHTTCTPTFTWTHSQTSMVLYMYKYSNTALIHCHVIYTMVVKRVSIKSIHMLTFSCAFVSRCLQWFTTKSMIGSRAWDHVTSSCAPIVCETPVPLHLSIRGLGIHMYVL